MIPAAWAAVLVGAVLVVAATVFDRVALHVLAAGSVLVALVLLVAGVRRSPPPGEAAGGGRSGGDQEDAGPS